MRGWRARQPDPYGEAAALLEQWREYRAVGILRAADAERVEERAAVFEQLDPDVAERIRIGSSDAGIYLTGLAEVRESAGSYLQRAIVVRETLDRERAWRNEYEWRISTYGSESIELVDDGRFRVAADCHGTFRVDFGSFPEAYEARGVLASLQMDLMYAVGWVSRAESLASRDDDDRYRYLRCLAHEARADAERLSSVVRALEREGAYEETATEGGLTLEASFRRSSQRWGPDGAEVPVIEIAVVSRSLTMRAEAATVERAVEFTGVYAQLARDLRRVLEWDWS